MLYTHLDAGDNNGNRRRANRTGASRDAGTDRRTGTHLNAHTRPDPVAISDSYLRPANCHTSASHSHAGAANGHISASHSHAGAANGHRDSSAAYGHTSTSHRHAGAANGHRDSSAANCHTSASHSHAGAANGHRDSSAAYGHTHATTTHIHAEAAGGRARYPGLQPSRPDGESRYRDNLD